MTFVPITPIHPPPASVPLSDFATMTQTATPSPNPAVLVSLVAGGHQFHVYTHSYLGFGLEAAQHLFASRLTSARVTEGNPCYLTGSKYRNQNGLGSYRFCQQMMRAMLFDTHDCSGISSCSWDGVFQPPIASGQTFFATENIWCVCVFMDVLLYFLPFSVSLAGSNQFFLSICSSGIHQLFCLWPILHRI